MKVKRNQEKIKKVVREGYAKIAKQDTSCCLPTNSCCGSTDLTTVISKKIGYTEQELKTVPQGANLGLGCGNPVALASLKKGETVLDLGSGAGFDCFLVARKVGKEGKIIGIDMTPEMIKKAAENAQKAEIKNVEFRLGEMENMPVDNESADWIISNCVINLSPDKDKVFSEAYRVLKPGGKIMVSDIVLLKELPDFIKHSIEAYIGCLAGAIRKDKYIEAIKNAGFKEVKIIEETNFPIEFMANDPTAKAIIKNFKISAQEIEKIADAVVSIKIYGVKPK